MTDTFVVSDIYPVLPELVLVVGAMTLLMVGAFRGERAAGAINWLSILLLVAAGGILAWLPPERVEAFGGSFVLEPYARFLKLLALIGSATAILMSLDYLKREQQNRFEYPILILLSTAGMLMLIRWGT
jgi:NADH-quinone oxidoreductase subunit N